MWKNLNTLQIGHLHEKHLPKRGTAINPLLTIVSFIYEYESSVRCPIFTPRQPLRLSRYSHYQTLIHFQVMLFDHL